MNGLFRSFDGGHVALAGVFSAGSGLARAAELAALTLESRGSKVTRVDLTASFGLTVHHPDERCILPADCGSRDITDVLVVMNPDHPSLSAFDRKWLLGRTIIGHWIWELEILPRLWGQGCRLLRRDLGRHGIQPGHGLGRTCWASIGRCACFPMRSRRIRFRRSIRCGAIRCACEKVSLPIHS